MEIRVHTDLKDPELVEAWDRLTGAVERGGLFGTRFWVEAWSAHFGSELKVAAAVGHTDHGPAGLAPLFATPARELVLPVNFLSPRGRFVAGLDDVGEFTRALLTHLRGQGAVLQLQGVPVGSPTVTALEAEARGGGYLLMFPLSAGDTGLLEFCDFSIDLWRSSGNIDEPNDLRTHAG